MPPITQSKGDAEMVKVCPLSMNTGGPLEGPQVPLTTIIPFPLHVLARDTSPSPWQTVWCFMSKKKPQRSFSAKAELSAMLNLSF